METNVVKKSDQWERVSEPDLELDDSEVTAAPWQTQASAPPELLGATSTKLKGGCCKRADWTK